VPVYVFRCADCGAEQETLLPLGETQPRPCPECGGEARQRFGRIAVRYGAWGFTATDRLVGDTRGKDYKSLRETAEKIADD
jgi:putative FmdB family regulatory protein